MKKDFRPKHLSSSSYSKKQTIPIASGDIRLNNLTYQFNLARQNAEYLIVGQNRPMGSYLIGLQNTAYLAGSDSSDNGDGGLLTYDTIIHYILNPDPNDPAARPTVIVPTDPQNVTVTWVGDDLQIEFDWDQSASVNAGISQFIVKLTADGTTQYTPANTFKPDRTQSHQTLLLTKAINTQMFNIFNPRITAVCVETADPFNNISNTICAATVPSYLLNLPTPTITVTNISNGYKVAYTTPTSSSFDGIDIWEIESTAGTAPTITYAADGITPTNYSRVYFGPLNPAIVISPNINKRWVVARFSSDGGVYTPFSTAAAASPVPPVTLDNIPPNEVVSVTGAWSGDNIVVNYTLPSTDAGVRFIVQLTSPVSSVAYYYVYPDGTSNLNQTATITKADLHNQFGAYYSSFSGLLKSVDAADNRSGGVSFTVAARANPLSGITPTESVVAISNGYTVNFNLPTAASFGEVYQKYTSWSGITDPKDFYTGTYSSGGSSGTNTLLVNGLVDDDNNSITTVPAGFIITGTGIPANTFVSNVSGSGTVTLTLSTYNSSGSIVASNLTQQASGTYTLTSLVYSGFGPATIPSTLYGNTYVVARYYDDWDNNSNRSSEVVVVPINPAVIDNTVPSYPTISSTAQSNNTITLSIVTTDSTTKGYRIRYKKSTDTLYTTDIVAPIASFSGGTSTTSYTINNLLPGITYNISGAGYNQYNGVGAYSTDINVSTSSPTVSTVSSIQLSALTYAILATWTAASNTPTVISKYKVELYDSTNTLLSTSYTFSTNISFSGLTASSTYYIKVYAQDIYNNFGAAVTSSNITLNASGQTSNGTGPSSSPTPTVKGLFGALQATWSPIANADSVTYEVHVSTTNNFSTSSLTKYIETPGTFAVIKTLPDGTALSYATTYYVKIIAKDFDGSASASTQASGSPSQVDNGDLATNSVRANVIQAGTITATQIDSTQLLVGKTFAVGAGSGDTSPIKIDASGTVTKLYSGTGTYANSNTPFYLDTTGQFSLKDRLYFDGNSTLTVNGVINAQSGSFTGAMTIGTSPQMKIGSSVNGSLNGIYIDSNNYWYTNGNFGIGATNNGVTWDGTNFNVSGGITAARGSFSGPMLMGSNGYILLGTSAAITNVSSNGTTITYTANNSFTAGKKVSITGIVPGQYNLTNATIATASSTQFTITNSATGTYQYGGLAIMTDAGNRIQIDKGTISAYDSTGLTTQIIGDGSAAYTFKTTSANIGGWTVDSSKLEAGSTGSYVGLSTGSTAFYAGATSSGGSGSKFSVTNAGVVTASNIAITGGTLDIGASAPNGFHVSNTGVLQATGATINGSVNITGASTFTGTVTITSPGSITSGVTGQSSGNGGYILNSNGLRFDSGITQGITQIDGTTGKLTTSSANIGGWDITSSQIYKASGNGNGNIYLDSSGGAMYVSATGVSGYTAGIVGPQSNATSNVFWAGTGGKNSTANDFRVTLDGHLYSNNANIKGTLVTSGALGTITVDGANDILSFTGTQYGYIFPRNNQMFYTTAFASSPFTSGYNDLTTVFANPMMVTGKLTNAYGTQLNGIGLYTGGISTSTYSSSGNTIPLPTTPWLSLTTTGIHLGASDKVGIKMEPQTGANPGITMYSSTSVDAYGIPQPSAAGAIKIQNNIVQLSSSASTFMKVGASVQDSLGNTYSDAIVINSGATTGSGGIVVASNKVQIHSTSDIRQTWDTNGIYLYATSTNFISLNGSGITLDTGYVRGTNGATAYPGSSKIVMGYNNLSTYVYSSGRTVTSGTQIFAQPFQGDIDITKWSTNYLGLGNLGPYARQRMLVEDPGSGVALLGMGIYYASQAELSGGNPTSGGYVGDLWVVY
jgi:hypothetical protein